MQGGNHEQAVFHQLLARSVNHGWAGLQSFDDPVDAPPFAAFPEQRFKPFAFLAAQPHTVSGLALDAKIRALDSSVAQPQKTMKTRACVIDFLSCISYTGTSYPDWVSS